ncbi:hypothetical protein [Halosolutus halophilus]|uniref:hypothetical protein n=1 Tax=Halosolutus halophilus TaxID=1552990 RepID=UPI00223517B2|nr:hypothetical protein [Halosolutus halophilus]
MAGPDPTAVTDGPHRHDRPASEGPRRTALRRGALGLAPIGAAVAMLIHPHVGDAPFASIAAAADTWLLVHVLLFASLPLLGVGTYLLLDRVRGRVALLGRLGAAVFTVCYGGYVAMVGLSSALIVRAGTGLAPAEQAGIDAALAYLLEAPAIMAVAGIGALGFLVAVAATAVGYRRRGVSIVPLALLFGAVVALTVHSGLVAVAGMLAFLVGVAWLEYSAVVARPHAEPTAAT